MNDKKTSTNPSAKEDKYVEPIDLALAETELENLKAEHGIEDDRKHGFVWNFIDRSLDRRENHEKVAVSKKKYLWLCLLGAFGAHRFYAKQYITAALYLLTCWTCFSVAMTIIDMMIIIPMKPDENGMIYL